MYSLGRKTHENSNVIFDLNPISVLPFIDEERTTIIDPGMFEGSFENSTIFRKLSDYVRGKLWFRANASDTIADNIFTVFFPLTIQYLLRTALSVACVPA